MGTTNRPLSAATVLGSRIRHHRQDLGWAQERLAAEAGLHSTYISSVERGERNISLRAILQIGGALGVDVGSLLEGLSL